MLFQKIKGSMLLNNSVIRPIYSSSKLKINFLLAFSRNTSSFELNEKYLEPDMQKQIEQRWRNAVINYRKENEINDIRNHQKKYVLSMFPYPSGNLHLGHVRVYAISDAISRIYHLKGWKVIHPMGWDAFGLPAENAAIERGVNPYEWTKSNIESMKNQLVNLGFSFDWWREVTTCNPDYYKWTQFIFLKLYHEGLAYRKKATVNWDPVDQTVLANEQVDENGCSWRSGAKVEKKILTQWFIKCLKFSKDLYEDLSDPLLENWKDICSVQKNWIGQCDGYIIEMKLIDNNNAPIDSFGYLSVWMREPEYLDSIGFLSVKSDHILNIDTYIDFEVDKFKVLNIKAVDPITNRLIPIVVCDDLSDEEAEIQVGLPCLKERDCDICKKFNFLIPPPINENKKNILREQVISKLKEVNSGGYESSSVLKDWLISRQRFWGTPIPIVYCKDCGVVPVPEGELPVVLPQLDKKIMKGTSLLKEAQDWIKCPCPRCGKSGERETDTMDTFVDSSWYFLRYLDPKNNKELVNLDKARNSMPVDIYIGGKEHAVLHLYYARFIQKFLNQIGLATCKEPFKQLLVQGLIKSKSYRVKSSGKYLQEDEVDFSVSPPVEKNTNQPLIIEFEKMSKSKFNGVNPQDLLDEFGIDALRLAILANVGPYSERLWKTEDMSISYKILTKLFAPFMNFIQIRMEQKDGKSPQPISEEEHRRYESFLFETRNQNLLKVNREFEETKQFHTAIRNLQEFLRQIKSVPRILMMSEEYEKCLRNVLLLLSPICPHLCCELWHRMNMVSTIETYREIHNIFDASWPTVDPTYEMELRCVVNEEKICSIRMPQAEYSTLTQETAVEMAYKNEFVSPLLNESPVLNVNFYFNANYNSSVHFTTKTKQEIKKIKLEKKKKYKISKNIN